MGFDKVNSSIKLALTNVDNKLTKIEQLIQAIRKWMNWGANSFNLTPEDRVVLMNLIEAQIEIYEANVVILSQGDQEEVFDELNDNRLKLSYLRELYSKIDT